MERWIRVRLRTSASRRRDEILKGCACDARAKPPRVHDAHGCTRRKRSRGLRSRSAWSGVGSIRFLWPSANAIGVVQRSALRSAARAGSRSSRRRSRGIARASGNKIAAVDESRVTTRASEVDRKAVVIGRASMSARMFGPILCPAAAGPAMVSSSNPGIAWEHDFAVSHSSRRRCKPPSQWIGLPSRASTSSHRGTLHDFPVRWCDDTAGHRPKAPI